MKINTSFDEPSGVLTVSVEGDVDISNVKELKSSLEECIIEYQPDIILNCEGLSYIDSTGLGVLVSALKKAQTYEKNISIIQLKPYLYKIFELTGLDKIFEIEVAG